MIKNGQSTKDMAKTETYKNEEILFAEIEKKISVMKPIASFYGDNGIYTELYKIKDNSFIYKNSLGEILVVPSRSYEFEQKLTTYPNMSQIPNKSDGAYELKSSQINASDEISYVCGFDDKTKDIHYAISLSDEGLIQIINQEKQNFLDLSSAESLNLSDIFLQICAERFYGEYTAEFHGNNNSKIGKLQGKKKDLSKEDLLNIKKFTDNIGREQIEAIEKSEDRKIATETARLRNELYGVDYKQGEREALAERTLTLQERVEQMSTERQKKSSEILTNSIKEGENVNKAVETYVKNGITSKDVLKYLLQDGKVRSGTFEQEQQTIKKALEQQKARESIEKLFE